MGVFKVRREKGITLSSLVITVIVLIIITSVIATNSYSSLQLSKITKLQNDIEQLNDRIAAYYVQNGKLPIDENETPMKKSEVSSKLTGLSVNDGDNYYTIKLNKIDNLSLNYGKGKDADDKYIINEETHMVYYYSGVNYKGETYYTTEANPAIVK